MWISDTSGHGHGDNNGDNSGDNSGDKSGDKSGEKCVNKRCGGISPTLYAVQYTGTDIHIKTKYLCPSVCLRIASL